MVAVQGGAVSIDALLDTASKCLGQSGAEDTGAAMLEGVLTFAPATCFAACLGVALAAPESGSRASMLRMLCKVPMELLPESVLAEAMRLVKHWMHGSDRRMH